MPAIRGEFLWDDYDHISESQVIRSPDGLTNIIFHPKSLPFPFGGQYYPLVYGSFWLEWRVWKQNTEGYHLPNILLHGGSAIVLYWLLRRLRVRGAWFCAMLFAVHPVHVESVAWITERKNTLSLFLALLAMRVYFPLARLDDDEECPISPRMRWVRYVGALLLFGASLLAKTVTCSWPAVLLLLQWWKRGKVRVADASAMIPFFALGMLAGLPTIGAEEHHVGASGADFDIPILQKLLLASKALWFYIGKLVIPFPLSFFYRRWELDTRSLEQWVLLVAAVAVPVLLFIYRRRLGRGPLAAFLIFAGVVFPALGFFKVYPMMFSWVADHFQYHASVAMTTLLGTTVVTGAGVLSEWRRLDFRKVGTVVCGVWLLVLSGLTWNRAHVFASQEALWRNTLRHAPEAWLAHQNLAVLLRRKGELDEAEKFARRSMELRPQNPYIYYNLGVIAQQRVDLPRAESWYREAVKRDPEMVAALLNLGSVLLQQARPREAIEPLERVTKINPKERKAWLALMEAYRWVDDRPAVRRARAEAEKLKE